MSDLVARSYRLILRPGRERSLELRHPWIFSGALGLVEALPTAEPGDLGEVYSESGTLLALATVNPSSQITGRVLRWDGGAVDGAWLGERLREALSLRREIVDNEMYEAFRWVHGEADGLPGLIVDRYGDYVVAQCLTLFWYRLRDKVAAALGEVAPAKGVLLKNRSRVRDPGVPEETAVLAGEEPPEHCEVHEDGVRLLVDLRGGQKTGLYLDQRENRPKIGRMARDKNVLVLFAYTGGFGIHAGVAGARRVTLVESSRSALELALRAWRLNGLPEDRLETHREDAWQFLRGARTRYDLVVVDPPALAKAARHVTKATRGYRDVNLHAMKRLSPGGWLATFSCSQHVSAELFQKTVFLASVDAGVPMRCVEKLGAGGDHPVLLDHPQGEYLKGLLLRSGAPAEALERNPGEGLA